MSFADGDHVGVAVAKAVGKCFGLCWIVAAAAGRRGFRPAIFGSIGWQGVGTRSMYKSPVAEADAITTEVPGGAGGILVIFDCTGNFSLVRCGSEFNIVGMASGVVKEGGNSLGDTGGFVRVDHLGVIGSCVAEGQVEVSGRDSRSGPQGFTIAGRAMVREVTCHRTREEGINLNFSGIAMEATFNNGMKLVMSNGSD